VHARPNRGLDPSGSPLWQERTRSSSDWKDDQGVPTARNHLARGCRQGPWQRPAHRTAHPV
jgi:hypothetical protein